MWPDRISNPGPLTYESGALLTALCGLAAKYEIFHAKVCDIWQGSLRKSTHLCLRTVWFSRSADNCCMRDSSTG